MTDSPPPAVARMDEETERLIADYGSECYEVGFQDAEDDQIVAAVARTAREKSEDALRLRIAALIEERYNIGYADGQLSGIESYRKEGWK